jgi:Spy/CpxP family protein refolding chaperone
MHDQCHSPSQHRYCHDSWRHEAGFEAGFGVRRPLRFLAYKLDLDEAQMTRLAQVLDLLKTERAQAAVDDRRTLSAFAEAAENEAFDEAKAREGAAARVKSAEALAKSVVTALGQIHASLRPEQRARLAYLIRTGALQL